MIIRRKGFVFWQMFVLLLVVTVSVSFLIVDILRVKASVASTIELPSPTALLPASKEFSYPLLKGLRLDPQNPLKIDFVIDRADKRKVSDDEASILVRYFLTSLTVPQSDLWVNLSPYENDRIISDKLATTEMGRDMLAQDYILKQLSSTLTYPENHIGKNYWSEIYKRVQKQLGTINVPLDSFNKVWIVPGEAVIYENDNFAVVHRANLKVMLEEDYLASKENHSELKQSVKQVTNPLIADVMREQVLPAIEEDVNNNENFAQLRQVYHALILAKWFKKKFENSFYRHYIDQRRVTGIDKANKDDKEIIYKTYVKAFEKGCYDYIKSAYDPQSQQKIKKRYFSGGLNLIGDVDVLSSSIFEDFKDVLKETLISVDELTHTRINLNPLEFFDTVLVRELPAYEQRKMEIESLIEQENNLDKIFNWSVENNKFYSFEVMRCVGSLLNLNRTLLLKDAEISNVMQNEFSYSGTIIDHLVMKKIAKFNGYKLSDHDFEKVEQLYENYNLSTSNIDQQYYERALNPSADRAELKLSDIVLDNKKFMTAIAAKKDTNQIVHEFEAEYITDIFDLFNSASGWEDNLDLLKQLFEFREILNSYLNRNKTAAFDLYKEIGPGERSNFASLFADTSKIMDYLKNQRFVNKKIFDLIPENRLKVDGILAVYELMCDLQIKKVVDVLTNAIQENPNHAKVLFDKSDENTSNFRDNLISYILGMNPAKIEDKLFKNGHISVTSDEQTHFQSLELHMRKDVFEMLDLKSDDVLYDLGSGYGHMVFDAALTTDVAKVVGIEYLADRVGECEIAKDNLQLADRVQFEAGDARDYDYDDATVFFLFNPFEAQTMDDVLKKIQSVAHKQHLNGKKIRIASVGMSSEYLDQQSWLNKIKSKGERADDKIVVYEFVSNAIELELNGGIDLEDIDFEVKGSSSSIANEEFDPTSFVGFDFEIESNQSYDDVETVLKQILN